MSQLDNTNITLILEYLKTPDDFISISQVSKKVASSLSLLTVTPIPLPPKQVLKFFPNVTVINLWNNEQLNEYMKFKQFDILSHKILNVLFEVDYSTAKSLQSENIVFKKVTYNATDHKKFGSKFEEFDVIPQIVALDDLCFENDNNIKVVNIPQTVTRLGKKCFSACSTLNFVVFPRHLSEIGDECFSKCNNLLNIEIPSTVTLLGESAFENCNTLNYVRFVNYDKMPSYDTNIPLLGCLTTFKPKTFKNCIELKVVHVPNSIASLGDQCFSNCSSLTEITLPKGLIEINSFCFENNASLIKVNIPINVITIGNSAFKGCVSIKNISISGNGIIDCGDDIFDGCSSLKQFNIQH
ncbi:hypothetical protein EIN_036180 [Entamoeba invadens IP1]|uniref:Leucine rich repeat containing protein BspA family protein n=1 Tax=Entamoeba invadens IP1 TaxID=370355 RepID=A0A0A1TY24_ENTIV|nr:hypothetical protein EIN_036180 [Entamoeba invadens IP1]ELP86321.1 hypothetical protein EIN_036180 [Entamoeba invadens IP1]|eukprot:XP_004185667.1 hypothetical protein EIN_036180 [Entamoeba invadens IP1]